MDEHFEIVYFFVTSISISERIHCMQCIYNTCSMVCIAVLAARVFFYVPPTSIFLFYHRCKWNVLIKFHDFILLHFKKKKLIPTQFIEKCFFLRRLHWNQRRQKCKLKMKKTVKSTEFQIRMRRSHFVAVGE